MDGGAIMDNAASRVVAALGSALLLLSATTPTFADSLLKQAPEHEKAIARCAVLKTAGELPPKKVEELPKDGDQRVYKITGHRGKDYVVFILGEGERAACQTLAVTKPVAKARGTFWPGKGGQDAMIMRGDVCNATDGCPSMLVFATKRGAIFAAQRRDGCPRGEKLKALALFGGTEHSLQSQCQSVAGEHETETLTSFIHVFKDHAQTLVTLSHGIARTTVVPAGKGTERHCTSEAPGWVKVAMRGSIPLLKSFQPLDIIEDDEDFGAAPAAAAVPAAKGPQGRQSVWKFDPEEKVFTEWTEKRLTRAFVNSPRCRVLKAAAAPLK